MEYSDYLRQFVLSLIPAPQLSTQTITIAAITTDPATNQVTQVTVNGLGDSTVAVDWSGSFAMQLAVSGTALVGAVVYLYYANGGQPTIGDTIIKGVH